MSDSIRKYEELVEEGKITPGRHLELPDINTAIHLFVAPQLIEAVVAIARDYKTAPASLVYTMALNLIKSGKITARD